MTKQTVTYARPDAKVLVLVAILPGQDGGQGGLETWTLPKRGKVTVGRDPSCDVVLDHPSISRVHAELEIGERLLVRDRGSRHGVTIDGVGLAKGESAELVVGGTGELGEVTILLQRHGDEAAPLAASRALTIGDHDALVGGSLARVLDVVRRVALGDLTVLVVGETGVGKDLVAELVHRTSARSSGPFVRAHCAALPAALFESELFGHERGAFTGATAQKRGLVEAANGGTLFLDEVGEIPLALQVKLLRILEDRRVTRVGGTTSNVVDVRFVAATNRDLVQEVDEGRFREDLYYRLSGFTVAIPPLRERSDEIVPLARAFLARAERGRSLTLGPSALDALAAHPFPGNVRELRLAIERAAALAPRDVLEASDLGLEVAADAQTGDDALRAAIEEAAGNQSEAARRLGISRRTLVAHLARLRARSG